MTLLLAALSPIFKGLLGLLARIPAIAWLVIALAVWGLHGHSVAVKAEAAHAKELLNASQAATTASEAARKKEVLLNAKNQEISDALAHEKTIRAVDARDAGERLRQLAYATSAPRATAAAVCRNLDTAPVAVLHNETRDALVGFARDADEIADRLRACQAYITTVR
jgi:hypothetical protein